MFKSFSRLMALILLLILLLILAGCGGGDGDKKNSSSPSASESVEASEDPSDDTEAGPSDDTEADPSDDADVSPSDDTEASPSKSASSSASKSTDPDLKKFDGYLMDVKSAKAGKNSDGVDVFAHPEKHTVKILKKEANAASGYGLMIMVNGKYKFYKFDSNGNKMIKRYVIDKTEKTEKLRVAVRGVLTDNVIAVKVVLDYK